jgi:acyl-CoA thioester hydrolase
MYQFALEFDVRDYECDLEGIVNNAVYQHYIEHARHIYLKSRGLDFAQLTTAGINLIVVRIEIDYLHPLRSGDRFVVKSNLAKVSRIRFGFRQDIFRLPDDLPIIRANVIGTAMNTRGRPFFPPELSALFPPETPSKPDDPPQTTQPA